MTTAEVATGSRPSSGTKGSTQAATWVMLLAFMLSGRAVWSSSYMLPCMPALWLEHRVTEGLGCFIWRYSEAGAILSGPSGGVLQSSFGPWERGLTVFAAVIVVSSAAGFIESGLRNQFGASAGYGVVFFASLAVFIWAQQAAVKQALEREAAAQQGDEADEA